MSFTLWELGGWILRSLRTITSTLFEEFVIWIVDTVYPCTSRYRRLSSDNWKNVDALLSILAERNPDFRVVFRGDFDAFGCSIGGRHDRVGLVVRDCLPLVLSKGLVRFEQVPHAENRFRKSGVLYVTPTRFVSTSVP